MILYPQTLEQAKLHKYNRWAGNPDGDKYKEGYCCYEIQESFGGWPHFRQCQRENGFGPAGLYCKQHAGKIFKTKE